MRTMRKLLKYVFDLVVVNLSVLVTLFLVCNFDIELVSAYRGALLWQLLILSVSYIATMLVLNGYRVLWQFAGTRDRFVFSLDVLISNVIYTIVHIIVCGKNSFPLSVYVLSAAVMLLLLQGLRVIYKVAYKTHHRNSDGKTSIVASRRVMLIGAGSAGNMILQDIKNDPGMKDYCAVCVIDDDPEKKGGTLGGVKIVGSTEAIAENVKKYSVTDIIFAIPSCNSEKRAKILKVCNETGCTVKTLPGFSQLMDRVDMGSVRDVQVEDLLGREPIRLDLESVKRFIHGKVVMVTGGGGSIGSELCRQIAAYGARQLIIFDIYENNAYDIQNELKRKYPDLDLVTLIGSIRDIERLDQVFEKYHPEVVYHAAAHKHVPLMEDSPNEAVKNNVFGTLNLVRTADKYGVKRFIQISTDKAVNPTNVMGATKRICEMIIQTYARRSKTEFAAVRFGNVLGSNGSVIPLFKKQIESGGPVTVTHPDIIRYFMTIPEAVSLVLEAGVDAHGGEIFVLDMGKPVKILELAENLIRLSGFIPYETMQIKFSGLRPGEKLFEELLMSEEGLTETANSMIFIGKPIELDEDKLFEKLETLRSVMMDDHADIRSYIHDLVPTYKMPEHE